MLYLMCELDTTVKEAGEVDSNNVESTKEYSSHLVNRELTTGENLEDGQKVDGAFQTRLLYDLLELLRFVGLNRVST